MPASPKRESLHVRDECLKVVARTPAHSMLAFALLVSGYAGWTLSEFEPHVRQAATLAARATELDDSDPWAHLALGYVAFTQRRTEEATEQFQRAIDLNPNFAAAHGYFGWALSLDGQSARAIPHLEQAIRMSPHDPQNAIFYVGLAAAHYLAGRYTEAVAFGRKAISSGPISPAAIGFTARASRRPVSLPRRAQSSHGSRSCSPKFRLPGSKSMCRIPPTRWRNSSKACGRPDCNTSRIPVSLNTASNSKGSRDGCVR